MKAEELKGTVTISIQDYENLVNVFENSKDKQYLESRIKSLTEHNEALSKSALEIVEKGFAQFALFIATYFIVKELEKLNNKK